VAPLHALRIAILDDVPIICDMLTELCRAQGHNVDSFYRPVEALAAQETCAYDVIISDMKMPGMSGMELYARIQAHDPAQAARMLFITGDVLTAETREFFERTGCLYISKPFKAKALHDSIAALLERCAESREG
jgi:CheY-like chemotaxis protein